jgi:hypothetical protein
VSLNDGFLSARTFGTNFLRSISTWRFEMAGFTPACVGGGWALVFLRGGPSATLWAAVDFGIKIKYTKSVGCAAAPVVAGRCPGHPRLGAAALDTDWTGLDWAPDARKHLKRNHP